MYINIYDLNFDTLWTKTILSITSYLLQKLIEKEEKKESRITALGSLAPRERFGFARFSLSLKQRRNRFLSTVRFDETKRNETKREDRLVSHETSSWLHARPQEDSHVSRPDPFPLPFPASLSSTIEFLSKRVFLSLIPLVDKSRSKVRGFNAMRSE